MLKEGWLRFKRFILPYPLGYLVKYILRIILWTCRFEVQGLDAFVNCAKKESCALALWHNRLAILPEVLHRFTKGLTFKAVISKSRDGAPLAVVVNSYKRGKTLRVAHNDRHGALRTLINDLKEKKDVLVITPDGPRGPRYALKPGLAVAAKAAGAHVVPFAWTADRFWKMKTWDGFMLPKPFSSIQITFGAPLVLSQESSLKQDVDSLTQHLMAIVQTTSSQI
jgi:lysophospholipid acyltransferase (LPLAT)-like uncharacterized protein